MKTFEIEFVGRNRHAIGAFYIMKTEVKAESKVKAPEILSGKYEYNHIIKIEEKTNE